MYYIVRALFCANLGFYHMGILWCGSDETPMRLRCAPDALWGRSSVGVRKGRPKSPLSIQVRFSRSTCVCGFIIEPLQAD